MFRHYYLTYKIKMHVLLIIILKKKIRKYLKNELYCPDSKNYLFSMNIENMFYP
jgi:hypothetical protein